MQYRYPKIMVGDAGWTMERSTISDASIPILADAIKWLGCLPKGASAWNLGVYGDVALCWLASRGIGRNVGLTSVRYS